MLIFNYSSEQEYERIINEQESKGLFLVKDSMLIDGNYLTFSNNPYDVPGGVSIEEQILAENQYQTVLLEINMMGGM